MPVFPAGKALTAGQTASVTFVNVFRLGQISVQKVNQEGTPLEGVEFLLEWSEDGVTWQPVTETTGPDYPLGSCTAPGLKEGKLVTGADGMAVFTMLEDVGSANAHAPLQVVNTKGFDLPQTGDRGVWMYGLIGVVLMAGSLTSLYLANRKKQGK